MDRINVDVSRYRDQKKAKTAAVVKLNGVVHLVQTRYDPATGAAQPQTVPIAREALENTLKESQEVVATLQELLADYDKAPEKLDKK